ncbi:unnamed protein product [Knipowitschia caucasica]
MAPPTLFWMLMLVATATGARSGGEENEVDYGHWNYREGADHVNVATVRSVTRVLDAWGKRIFNEIKTLLHSQPSALLPDYSRVRPLSESVNDLFREVSLLHLRITELTHRLATLDPFLRHHGYHGEGAVTPLRRHAPGPSRGTRVLRRRRVKIFNTGGVQVLQPDT